MQRSEPRHPLAMPAQCRTSVLRVFLQVVDLSESGCRIAVGNTHFSPGQKLVLKPAQMESLLGEIKWCDGQFAGVQFDRKIYGPIVEHLCRSNPDMTTVIPADLAA